MYQVALEKLNSYTFGVSLYSCTAVLCAYMLGLSLGSYLFGVVADRTRKPLLTYALLEGGIAAFGLLIPVTNWLTQRLYLSMASEADLGSTRLHLVRLGLAVASMLPITALMGGTLPVLLRAAKLEELAEASEPEVESSVIYAANLLGALAGTLLATHVVMPVFGIAGAILVAAAGNLFVMSRALRRRRGAAALKPTAEAPVPARAEAPVLRWAWMWLAALALFSGWAFFALEIIWTHLLATVIGNSVYAFGNMLAAILLALYLGARLVARRKDLDDFSALYYALAVGGMTLAVTLPLWEFSPYVFKLASLLAPGFYLRELVRLLVAIGLILPAAVFLAQVFPRLLDISGRQEARRPGLLFGFLLAVNTFGCLLGAVMASYWLLPQLGSFNSLRLLAALCLAPALILPMRHGSLRHWRAAVPAVVLALSLALVPTWSLKRLLSAYNVYFTWLPDEDIHKVLWNHEDAEGGFKTVIENSDGRRVMLTNGKYEGNDRDLSNPAFAHIPALLARNQRSALVIGVGTGVTAGTLSQYPFQRIVMVDLSRAVAYAAANYFNHVNGDVLNDPRVMFVHEDGRNYLAVTKQQFDVITIELTSIWFSGAANLYNDEFYRLCRKNLAPGGVLLQWVQFHHMDRATFWTILNTVRRTFPHVQVWEGGGQGYILAGGSPLELNWPRVEAMNRKLAGTQRLSFLAHKDLRSIAGALRMDEAATDQFVSDFRFHPLVGRRLGPLWFARDYWPILEYETPRNNVLSDTQPALYSMLDDFGKRRLPVLAGVSDPADWWIVSALAAWQRGDPAGAGFYLAAAAERFPDNQEIRALLAEVTDTVLGSQPDLAGSRLAAR